MVTSKPFHPIEGLCGEPNIRLKVFKNGFSMKCLSHQTRLCWWKLEDIKTEVKDFCFLCPKKRE